MVEDRGRRWHRGRGGTVAFVVAALVSVLTVAYGVTSGAEREAAVWDLVFVDDFDGRDLHTRKWATCYWWDDRGCTNRGNNELQWYQRDNLEVRDGELHLVARRERVDAADGRRYVYTSGIVTTGRMSDDRDERPRFAFTYGRVEVRMWIPSGRGLWPAIWMLPLTHESEPEIDIMEVLGHEPGVWNAHFHYTDGGEEKGPGTSLSVADLSRGWHVFGMRWGPQEIVWTLDGEDRLRFAREEFIPRQRMYLLINLAVGGDWPGDPGAQTEFPARLRVDHVKIWQRR